MQENEKIADFFTRLCVITNAMGPNGEQIIDQQFCENVLRSLTPIFDCIVCSVESTIQPVDLKIC